MKTLYLLRHAKSSWDDPQLADFERPLSERGIRAAPFMGKYLKANDPVPALIVSSPATRARQTAEMFTEALGFNGEIVFDGRIYEASPRALREVASETDDSIHSVMLVGHNPGMEGFLRYLTDKIEPMPTAAIAIIDLDFKHWDAIDPGSGKLRKILRPKELMHR